MIYSALADTIVALHFSFVGYVVIGQILIWVGITLRWAWVRNPWFRITHLLAILIVGLEAVGHINCPLTVWEMRLRELAGQPLEEGSFIGRLLHAAIFVDVDAATLDMLHIIFAVLVLGTFLLWPPIFRRRVVRPTSWSAHKGSRAMRE